MSTAKKYRWTLTIDRAKWLTGSVLKSVTLLPGSADSTMLSSLYDDKTGLQCCLGFGCNKAGVPVADIINISLPSDVNRLSPGVLDDDLMCALKTLEEDGGEDTAPRTAVSVNDDENITQKEREADLRELFARKGIRLRFTGDHKAAIRTAQRHYGKRPKVTR